MNDGTGHVFEAVTLGDLGVIRRYVRETAMVFYSDTKAVDELVVAVNEAVANIIRHGYGDESGPIEVTVSGSPERVKVTVLDGAPAFDPTQVASPDTTLPLAQRRFGGMGVHLMRELCDELIYRRTPEGQNEIILVKQITTD